MTFEESSGNLLADLVRIVNQSTANRRLFRLRPVNEIRASFANRDEGADRNAWLYSYNPLTVKLV
jgi:salicylate hydroxylase